MTNERPPAKLAYLGLGIMGSAMTLNFAQAGYAIVAWNRTRARDGVDQVKQNGVRVVESIQEAVSDADYIFSCLGDVPDVEQVLLGSVIKHAQKNAVVIDMTTIGKAAAATLAPG